MPERRIYNYLLDHRRKNGAGLLVLLDPDRTSGAAMAQLAQRAEATGAAAFLFGTSFLTGLDFEDSIREVKRACQLPVILFPGNSRQLTRTADAVLLLSLLSGRNPQYLIGEQVIAAPLIKKMELEAIATGYLLIESGRRTTAEFISGSPPIPRDKPELAAAHALAAELLGFRMVYLEAGSGAEQPVPPEMISAVRQEISIPLIVGGGIRTPEMAQAAVAAGADFIVVGNHFEASGAADLDAFITRE